MSSAQFLVIGCGAVWDLFYRPYFASRGMTVDGFDPFWSGATPGGRIRILNNESALRDNYDFAVVLTPYSARYEALEVVRHRSQRILFEKPFALTGEDFQSFTGMLKEANCTYSSAYIRTLGYAHAKVKELISGDVFSEINYFDGGRYSWPVRTPSVWSNSNGGVLGDTGPHILSQLLDWVPDLSVRRAGRGPLNKEISSTDAYFICESESRNLRVNAFMSRQYGLGCRVDLKLRDGGLGRMFPLDDVLVFDQSAAHLAPIRGRTLSQHFTSMLDSYVIELPSTSRLDEAISNLISNAERAEPFNSEMWTSS